MREAREAVPDMILVDQKPDLYRRMHALMVAEIRAVLPIGAVKSIDELTCPLDGRAIAFESSRIGSSVTWDLHVMRADIPNNEENEYPPSALTRGDAGRNWAPEWSPDGSHVVFASTRHGNYEIYVGNIVAMLNDAGYEPYRVTTNEHMDVLPQWSPDGTRIAFTSWQGDHKHVWVVDADGTNLERVTSGPAGTENGLGTWSPDGTKIAFVSNRGGGYDIYMMDAAGENGRSA